MPKRLKRVPSLRLTLGCVAALLVHGAALPRGRSSRASTRAGRRSASAVSSRPARSSTPRAAGISDVRARTATALTGDQRGGVSMSGRGRGRVRVAAARRESSAASVRLGSSGARPGRSPTRPGRRAARRLGEDNPARASPPKPSSRARHLRPGRPPRRPRARSPGALRGRRQRGRHVAVGAPRLEHGLVGVQLLLGELEARARAAPPPRAGRLGLRERRGHLHQPGRERERPPGRRAPAGRRGPGRQLPPAARRRPRARRRVPSMHVLEPERPFTQRLRA